MSIVCDNNFVSSLLQHHTISHLLHGTVNWKHLVWELKASLDLAWSILGAKELWWSPDALAFLVFILLPWKFSSCRCPVKCGGRQGGNHWHEEACGVPFGTEKLPHCGSVCLCTCRQNPVTFWAITRIPPGKVATQKEPVKGPASICCVCTLTACPQCGPEKTKLGQGKSSLLEQIWNSSVL